MTKNVSSHLKRKKIIVVIAVIALLVFVAAKIVGYVRVSNLCEEIKAGKNIETNISNGTSAPVLLTIVEPIFDWTFVEIPLVEACYYRNVQAVEVLLENGANPNFFFKGRWSPIEAAIVSSPTSEKSFEIIKMLVEHGCDVNLHASREPVLEILSTRIVLGDDSEITREIFLYLLDNGADRSWEGESFLHNIVRGGDMKFAQMLIEEYGFSVNDRGHGGKTPLIISASYLERSVKVEMVEMLIEHGADTTMTDDYGKTALDYAVELGYDEIAQVLSEN